MRITSSLYPYPVLSNNNDDYEEEFTFQANYNLISNKIAQTATIKLSVELNESEINSLITNNKAQIFLHIECNKTSLRQLHAVSNSMFELEIELSSLRNNVELSCFVLATDKIPNWQNKNINVALYGNDYVFPLLSKGNVLALANSAIIELPEYDNTQHLPSIIKITTSDDLYMKVNYDSDIIFIYLAKKQYQQYLNYPNQFGEILLSSIITPALIYILENMKNNVEEDLKERRWYQIIEEKMRLLNYTVTNLANGDITTVEMAQKILHDPLTRMFEQLEGIINEDI